MLGAGTSKHCGHPYRVAPLSSATVRAQGTPLSPRPGSPHLVPTACTEQNTGSYYGSVFTSRPSPPQARHLLPPHAPEPMPNLWGGNEFELFSSTALVGPTF